MGWFIVNELRGVCGLCEWVNGKLMTTVSFANWTVNPCDSSSEEIFECISYTILADVSCNIFIYLFVRFQLLWDNFVPRKPKTWFEETIEIKVEDLSFLMFKSSEIAIKALRFNTSWLEKLRQATLTSSQHFIFAWLFWK